MSKKIESDESWKAQAAAEKEQLAATDTPPPSADAPSIPPGHAGIALIGDPETGLMRLDISGGQAPVSMLLEPLQVLKLTNQLQSASLSFIDSRMADDAKADEEAAKQEAAPEPAKS